MNAFARKLIACAVFLLFSIATPAQADFEAGQAAYASGDYHTALKEWRPLAEQGGTNAQTNLRTMYANGLGVPLNYGEAVNWFRKAAERGNALASAKLGMMYGLGLGVPEDYVQSYMWLILAGSSGLDEK